MQKQFVTYEIALSLKELGFNEPCLGFFDKELFLFCLVDQESDCEINTITYENGLNNIIADINYETIIIAPLYQQVIDWFREKHNIHISIPNYYDGWSIDIRGFKQNINLEYHSEPGICLENYYEAREQAILKVIELCQKEK